MSRFAPDLESSSKPLRSLPDQEMALRTQLKLQVFLRAPPDYSFHHELLQMFCDHIFICCLDNLNLASQAHHSPLVHLPLPCHLTYPPEFSCTQWDDQSKWSTWALRFREPAWSWRKEMGAEIQQVMIVCKSLCTAWFVWHTRMACQLHARHCAYRDGQGTYRHAHRSSGC